MPRKESKRRQRGKAGPASTPSATSSSADRLLAEIAEVDLFLAAELRKMLAGTPPLPPAPMVGVHYQPTVTSTTR